MTSYLDPYTLEESMREIRSSRKEIERLRTEVLDLKATIQIYVRELAELHKASSAPTIPEGWQLVPKEATNEMCHKGVIESGQRIGMNQAYNIYRMMLDAAPSKRKQNDTTRTSIS